MTNTTKALLGVIGILSAVLVWYPFYGAKTEASHLKVQLKELKEEHAGLQKLYDTIKKRFQDLEGDRENVLIQTKHLSTERERLLNVELEYKKKQEESAQLTKINARLTTENEAFKKETAELKANIKQAKAENETLKKASETLSKENQELTKTLSKTDENIASLKKDAAQKKEYKKESERLNKENKRLRSENKKLKNDLKRAPKKFSNIAHENKSLVRETADMHYNLGVFYTKEKRFDRAIEEFKKTIELNPDDSKAHYNLGYIYAEHFENRKKAELHFRRFLGLDPEDESSDFVRNYLATRNAYDGKILKS